MNKPRRPHRGRSLVAAWELTSDRYRERLQPNPLGRHREEALRRGDLASAPAAHPLIHGPCALFMHTTITRTSIPCAQAHALTRSPRRPADSWSADLLAMTSSKCCLYSPSSSRGGICDEATPHRRLRPTLASMVPGEVHARSTRDRPHGSTSTTTSFFLPNNLKGGS